MSPQTWLTRGTAHSALLVCMLMIIKALWLSETNVQTVAPPPPTITGKLPVWTTRRDNALK